MEGRKERGRDKRRDGGTDGGRDGGRDGEMDGGEAEDGEEKRNRERQIPYDNTQPHHI